MKKTYLTAGGRKVVSSDFTFSSKRYSPELAANWTAELDALPDLKNKTIALRYHPAATPQLEQHRSALSPDALFQLKAFISAAVHGFVRIARTA